MNGNGRGPYWRELLDRIRDIRSSEKVVYRQMLDLYATAVDYDPRSEISVEFFKIVQNKLHFAVLYQIAEQAVAIHLVNPCRAAVAFYLQVRRVEIGR